ncbi:MAG: MerR family transcriptional regulator [Bulleidia sp.]|nr:MerR family transcriptional regulator [Bulleidia sp.]
MNIIEAARSTGASRDTIRFYEKLGIIHPARNPSNNYRDYSDHDIYMIIMARLYASMGVPLKTIAGFMQTENPSGIMDALSFAAVRLEEEERWIRARRRLCKDNEKLFSMMTEGRTFDTGRRGTTWFYNRKDVDLQKVFAQPYVVARPIFVVHPQDFYKDSFPEVNGFEFAAKLDDRLPCERVEAHDFFRTLIHSPGQHDVDPEILKTVLSLMEQNGYKPCGNATIYVQTGTLQKENGYLLCVEVACERI